MAITLGYIFAFSHNASILWRKVIAFYSYRSRLMEMVIASYSYRSALVGNDVTCYSSRSQNVTKAIMFNAVTFEVTLPTSGQKPMQTLASWGKKQPNEGFHGICQWFSSSSQFANTFIYREKERSLIHVVMKLPRRKLTVAAANLS
jgi:hypothetical protein